MKKFETYKFVYEVYECTAIAECDTSEGRRQNALYVVFYTDWGEKKEYVVFGFEMPQDEDDWKNICDDSVAWENDWEVLKTVRDIC